MRRARLIPWYAAHAECKVRCCARGLAARRRVALISRRESRHSISQRPPWRLGDRSPGDGRACAPVTPRTASFASPLCRHHRRRFKPSWVRPATPICSRNRKIRATSASCLNTLRRALRTTSFLAARSIGNRARRAALRLSRLRVLRLRRYVAAARHNEGALGAGPWKEGLPRTTICWRTCRPMRPGAEGLPQTLSASTQHRISSRASRLAHECLIERQRSDIRCLIQKAKMI